MTRAALYVRVSTTEQAEEGYSIDEQVERLEAYCKSRGWEVGAVYRDPGFTGSNIRRPGLESLLSDINAFDVILVYKLDRLSRSQKDTLYLIEDVFLPSNTDFVSLSENFDTSTPFGRAMIGILSVFAQLEREQIKERMQMGKLGRIKKGKPSAWSKVPFGYIYEKGNGKDKGRLLVDDLTAPVVREMFALYLDGMSITKLVDHLNDAGHIGKDKLWTYRTTRKVLDNAVYAGFTNFKGEIYAGEQEPLISVEDYEKTQSELERRQQEAYAKNNNPRPFQAKYLLSGLVRCGRCGAVFELIQRSKRKDGTRPKLYKCISQASKKHNRSTWKNPDGCDSPSYPMEELEFLVLGELEKLRLNPGMVAGTEKHDDGKSEVAALEKRLAEIKAAVSRLVVLYTRGDMPLDILDEEKEKLETERDGIEAKLAKLKSTTPALPIDDARALLASFPTNIRDLDYETQKSVLRSLVDRITLDGDNITIRWRFL
jgi:site-specific DNA recombinase